MATSIVQLIANNPTRLVGLKQVVRGISEGIVWCVIVASDSDEFVLQRIRDAIGDRKVSVKTIDSKSKLGALAGIEVAASVVGLVVTAR